MYDIDFVVLWVDETDARWREERSKYYKGELNQLKTSAYRDWGTLPYWFRGIEKYTPWVHNVFFVTYGHLPAWLNVKHPKLKIIRHKDFIPCDFLPTFSANSIELNINKIPDLSEHFVYLNDDTFITDNMEPEDFFVNGLPCDTAVMSATIPSVKNEIFTYILFNDLLLINSNFNKKDVLKCNYSKWLNLKYGKYLLKNLYYLPVGKFTGFENLHLPNAYLKSVWDEVWNVEGDILKETIARRFRTKEDINQYIFRYWQLVTGKFTPRSPKIGKCYVLGQDDTEIFAALKNHTYKMLCVNDNPYNVDFEQEQSKLLEVFQSILPEKSSFEI